MSLAQMIIGFSVALLAYIAVAILMNKLMTGVLSVSIWDILTGVIIILFVAWYLRKQSISFNQSR